MSEGKVEKINHESDSEPGDTDDIPLFLPFWPQEEDYHASTKCKGCKRDFVMTCPKGMALKDSPSVQAFYSHCVKECPAYEELGRTVTCDACKHLFFNESAKNVHLEHCETLQKKKGLTKPSSLSRKSPLSKVSKVSNFSESGSDGEKSLPLSAPLSNSVENNDKVTEKLSESTKKDDENLEQSELDKELERRVKELIADDKPNPKRKPRPGSTSSVVRSSIPQTPPSRVGKPSSSKVDKPSTSSPDRASTSKINKSDQTSTPLVQRNSRNTSGENSPNQINSSILSTPSSSHSAASTSRSAASTSKARVGPASRTGRLPIVTQSPYQPSPAPNTPTREKTKKVEKVERLGGKDMSSLKKAISCNRRKSTPSDRKIRKKMRARSYSPQASHKNQRHDDTGEDSDAVPDVDSDGEPVVHKEFLEKIPPVKLEKKDYLIYIPKKSKSQNHFNSHFTCKACKEQFPCATFNDGVLGRGSAPKPVYSEDLYVHCLSKCEAYMKSGKMKECETCFHRYLDDDEFKIHKRNKMCQKNREKAKKLRWKVPWMPQQQYFDLIEEDANDKMNCDACSQTFPAVRRGHNYKEGIKLYYHKMDECMRYHELGLKVWCEKCQYWFASQKEYEKYDPCFKPPENQPHHGKPDYRKPDYI